MIYVHMYIVYMYIFQYSKCVSVYTYLPSLCDRNKQKNG